MVESLNCSGTKDILFVGAQSGRSSCRSSSSYVQLVDPQKWMVSDPKDYQFSDGPLVYSPSLGQTQIIHLLLILTSPCVWLDLFFCGSKNFLKALKLPKYCWSNLHPYRWRWCSKHVWFSLLVAATPLVEKSQTPEGLWIDPSGSDWYPGRAGRTGLLKCPEHRELSKATPTTI